MVVDPDIHIWGTRGRLSDRPRDDDLCYLCGERFDHMLGGCRHETDPSRTPLRWVTV